MDNPRYARIALGIPGILVFIFGLLWAIDNSGIYKGAISFYGMAIVIVLGTFLLFKGFGLDRSAKNFYKWARDYEPPPLLIQISNYTVIAGILCIAVSVYLGIANVNMSAAPFPEDLGGLLGAAPRIAAYFIKGIEDLLIVGTCIVLLGRSVRLYIERDSKLLRNAALIVSIAWFRWILDSTANLIYNPLYTDKPIASIDNPFFTTFLFTIVIGILIGIASILLIYIINKSNKDFFKKKSGEPGEL